MPNYNFKTLSPIDFECLIRDLFQEELKIRLESFKIGRGNGIDLRYTMPHRNGASLAFDYLIRRGNNDLAIVDVTERNSAD